MKYENTQDPLSGTSITKLKKTPHTADFDFTAMKCTLHPCNVS